MSKTTKRGPAVKKAAKRTEESTVPSLAELLGTIGGHVEHLMTYAPGARMDLKSVYVGMGVGGYPGTDCPFVLMQGTITRVSEESTEAAWGPWAQVVLNGDSCGNRHGGVKAVTTAYAPVVAWVAAYWAARAASEAPVAAAVAS